MSMTKQHTFTEMNPGMTLCIKADSSWIICWLISPHHFSPYENLTTDEGVCGYQGRVIFSVYMKNKPDKYDIKMFTLCHSKKGYVLCTEVYTGKGQQENSITGLLQQFSWTDFTAHQLFLIPCGQERPKLQVHACQIKNNCQDNMLCQKNWRDECVFMRRNHLLCLKLKDTWEILCLSTAHKMTTINVEVWCKDGVKAKSKPDAILE